MRTHACVAFLRENAVKVINLRLYIGENIKAALLLTDNGCLDKWFRWGFQMKKVGIHVSRVLRSKISLEFFEVSAKNSRHEGPRQVSHRKSIPGEKKR